MWFVVYSSQCEAWNTHQMGLAEPNEGSLGRKIHLTLPELTCIHYFKQCEGKECVCDVGCCVLTLEISCVLLCAKQRLSRSVCLIPVHRSSSAVLGNLEEIFGEADGVFIRGGGVQSCLFKFHLSREEICMCVSSYFIILNQDQASLISNKKLTRLLMKF